METLQTFLLEIVKMLTMSIIVSVIYMNLQTIGYQGFLLVAHGLILQDTKTNGILQTLVW